LGDFEHKLFTGGLKYTNYGDFILYTNVHKLFVVTINRCAMYIELARIP